jgi:ubiquinone/menaquinone biosynthesis C-methylase UbiE
MSNKRSNGDLVKRFASKGIFPYQFAFTLLIPLRSILLSPVQLIKRLEISDDMPILEVGPGPGYFSLKIARILVKGKLVLADIQQEMLDYARRRIDRKGFTNVEYYNCDGRKFKLPDNNFDRIFMVTVIGEVKYREQYMYEF